MAEKIKVIPLESAITIVKLFQYGWSDKMKNSFNECYKEALEELAFEVDREFSEVEE